MLCTTDAVYIGLVDRGDREWTWTHSNRPLGSYTNWDVGEPNLAHEHCVFTIRQKWHDIPCTTNVRFLCEGKLSIVVSHDH